MKPIHLIVALSAVLGLSACASFDTVSRNTSAPMQVSGPQPLQAAGSIDSVDLNAALAVPYDVMRVDVQVPETLKVSAANSYFPIADIVWHEDPLGNRYDQVKAIVQGAADTAVASMNDGHPVIANIQITAFMPRPSAPAIPSAAPTTSSFS